MPSRGWGAKDEGGVVQILNEVLAQRNKKITTVAARGGDMIRTIGDFVDECDRVSNQTRWLNFCKAARGAIRKYIKGRVRVIDSNVSREVVGGIGKVANNSETK